jgi:ferredoxin
MSTKIIKVSDILKAAESMDCVVNRSLFVLEQFLNGPMCGKCFPCSMGSFEARIRLKDIFSAMGTMEDIEALKVIGVKMSSMSMCKKGKDIGVFLTEVIDDEAFKEHVNGLCSEMVCEEFYEYRNVKENCIRCGKCQEVCRFGAIMGEVNKSIKCCHLPFEIRQKKCTKCGECIKVCPSKAIIKANIEIIANVPA